jgi:hypothetical protein
VWVTWDCWGRGGFEAICLEADGCGQGCRVIFGVVQGGLVGGGVFQWFRVRNANAVYFCRLFRFRVRFPIRGLVLNPVCPLVLPLLGLLLFLLPVLNLTSRQPGLVVCRPVFRGDGLFWFVGSRISPIRIQFSPLCRNPLLLRLPPFFPLCLR